MIHFPTRRNRVVSFQSFEHLHFFNFFQLFLQDYFFLRRGEGSITWNVIFIVYNLIDNCSRREREFRQLGPSRTTVFFAPQFFFCLRKKLLKSSEK